MKLKLKLITIIFVLLAIPITIIAVKQINETRSRASETTTSLPTEPVVGVIRWDAWTPNLHPTTSTQNKWILADINKWSYRLPFFAKNVQSSQKDSEAINEDSQETIDQEILYTSQAGIDYFAFFWFDFWWQDSNTSWRYNYALNHYLNSPNKDKINFSLIIGCCGVIDHYPTDWEPKVVPKIVNLVKDPQYQKVLNGRPIIYFFGASNLRGWFNCGFYDSRYGTCADKSFEKSQKALLTLREKIQEAGLPNPYLVAMVWDPLNIGYISSSGYRFDAISSYSGHNANIDSLTEKTYQNLIDDNNTYRERAKTAGNKIIPPVNTGWDRRPDPNYHAVWYQAGTPAQVGANLKAAVDWNKANPSLAETNNIIVYAWNEFVEGGWLGPTIDDKGARLNAIADALGGTHITPIPTPRPTSTPSPRPTSTPTPRPSATPTPSATPLPTGTPTPSPKPSDTVLHFASVKLHGIGRGGDNTNPDLSGNLNPLTRTRKVTVEIFNVSGSLVSSSQGNIVYNSTSGDFSGDISLENSLTSGSYIVKVRGDTYLRRQLEGVISITKASVNQMPSASLVAGDSNGDGVLSILDYNMIIDCYSDLLPARNCSDQTKKTRADISDDGKVNQDDYNLFLRELSVVSGD